MIVVLLIAMLTRLGWLGWQWARGSVHILEFDDERQYWQMAASFHAGDGLRDDLGFCATRMPLYPALLSLFVDTPHGVLIAKTLQSMLGALAAALAVGAASTLFGLRIGFLAGLLVAFDPFLIFFSSLLLTETGFVVLLIGFFWSCAALLGSRGFSWPRWLLTAALASLCVYQRESSLGLVLATTGWVSIVRRKSPWNAAGVTTVILIVFASLFPWAVRNRRLTGEWCWLTTRAGISLYDGVGPQATGASDLGDVKQMDAVRQFDEADWNRYFLEESKKAIARDPARILRLAVKKMERMWNPFPNVATHQSTFTRMVSVAWFVPTMTLALIGVLLVPRTMRYGGFRCTVLLLMPAVYLSLVHCLFVGSVRYRLGAVPFLHMLAAVAIVVAWDHARARETGEGDAVGA